MKKINAKELTEMFPVSVDFTMYKNKVFVIDNYYLWDEGWDYGLWNVLDLDEIEHLELDQVLPDIHFVKYFENLFDEGLSADHGWTQKEIDDFYNWCNGNYDHADEYLKEHEYTDVYKDVETICKALRGEIKLYLDADQIRWEKPEHLEHFIQNCGVVLSDQYNENSLTEEETKEDSLYVTTLEADMAMLPYNTYIDRERGLVTIEIEPKSKLDSDDPVSYEMIINSKESKVLGVDFVYEDQVVALNSPDQVPYAILNKFCEIAQEDPALGFNIDSIKENRSNWDLLEENETETDFGEPQYIVYLKSGRSIEVTLEQKGLKEEDEYYCVRYLCSDKEYENGDFRLTDGIIDVYNMQSNSENSYAKDEVLQTIDWIVQKHQEMILSNDRTMDRDMQRI